MNIERNLELIFFFSFAWNGAGVGSCQNGSFAGAGDGKEGENLRKINIIAIFQYKDANGILS